MSEKDDAQKEYELLRGEISENSRIASTVFLGSITVTVAIFSFGFTEKLLQSNVVVLLPLAVLIPSQYFIASKLESTTRISQYLRVVVEPKTGYHWQEHWYQLRMWRLLPTNRKYIAAINVLFIFLGLACYGLCIVRWIQFRDFSMPKDLILLVLMAGSAVILDHAAATVHQAFSMRLRSDYAESWEKLQEKNQE